MRTYIICHLIWEGMGNLKQTGVEDSQIISVNPEELENADMLYYNALYKYITSKLVPDKNN